MGRRGTTVHRECHVIRTRVSSNGSVNVESFADGCGYSPTHYDLWTSPRPVLETGGFRGSDNTLGLPFPTVT